MLTFILPTPPSREIEVNLDKESVEELITILQSFVNKGVKDHYHLMLGNELTEVAGELDDEIAMMVTLRFST